MIDRLLTDFCCFKVFPSVSKSKTSKIDPFVMQQNSKESLVLDKLNVYLSVLKVNINGI